MLLVTKYCDTVELPGQEFSMFQEQGTLLMSSHLDLAVGQEKCT